VGVVADVPHEIDKKPQPDAYFNFRQQDIWSDLRLVVRAKHGNQSIVPAVRAAIKEFDPVMPCNEFTTLDHIVERAISPRRLITGILSSFSSCALLLATIGLYGIIAYSVSRRTQEIGIRVAMGAQRLDIMRLVVFEGLALAGIGVVIGLGAACFVTRILRSQLYGVSAGDPLTFMMTAVILITVTLLACYFPARYATRIDPMEALRYE
jgi:ABC-type antimicrobial peptide transport system permease subunit